MPTTNTIFLQWYGNTPRIYTQIVDHANNFDHVTRVYIIIALTKPPPNIGSRRHNTEIHDVVILARTGHIINRPSRQDDLY